MSIGLGDDPIQPLVIRANQGDCVQINFTNKASGGEYGVHIDGLSYDVASSGDAVGDNDSSSVGNGESRSYRFYVPDEPESRARTTSVPAPATAPPPRTGCSARWPSSRAAPLPDHPTTGKPIASGWEARSSPAPARSSARA